MIFTVCTKGREKGTVHVFTDVRDIGAFFLGRDMPSWKIYFAPHEYQCYGGDVQDFEAWCTRMLEYFRKVPDPYDSDNNSRGEVE